MGEVVELTEEIENTPSVKAMAKELSELFKKAINAGKQAEIMTVMKLISGQVEPVELADQIATLLEIKVIEKQKLLEMFSLIDVVSLANNHTDDLGTLVETETQAYLKFIGMQWFGSSHYRRNRGLHSVTDQYR